MIAIPLGLPRLEIESFNLQRSRTPLFYRRQNIRHNFGFGFRADVAFAVDADADVAGFHVARADDEHGVDPGLLGVGDLRLDGVGTEIALATDEVRAQFADDGLG